MKEEVGRTIICLRNEIIRTMDMISGEDGLSRAQGSVLHYIDRNSENKDIYQKDIEQVFNLRRASASELLMKLETAGLIERVVDKVDKRLKKLVVCEKGKEHIQKIQNDIVEMEDVLHKDLNEEDLQAFFRVIKQMFINCENVQKEKKGEIL